MRSHWFFALGIFCTASPLSAASIVVSPGTQTALLSSTITLDLNISDLGSGSAPSVGVYDLTVTFNPAILSFSSVLWGTGLDVLSLGSLQSLTAGTGTVNVFELSLDLASDLNSLQPDSFRLFTLSFSTLSFGTTSIAIILNSLGDADGANLPVTLTNGFVTVGPESSVPEPGSAPTTLAGVLILFSLRMSPWLTSPVRRFLQITMRWPWSTDSRSSRG